MIRPQFDTVPSNPIALARARRSQRGNETILVVEDDALVRGFVAYVLGAAGLTVLTASNGEEGLEVWRKHRADVGVLLTDIEMPGMSGPELAAQLAEENANVALLFMSGGASTLSDDDGFLAKPFTPDELVQKVRGAIDEGSDWRSLEGEWQQRCG